MADDRMKFEDVRTWVGGVLGEYDGLYDVQDHLFVRQAVRVVTKRRDACFDILTRRWADEAASAPDRVELASDLKRWARQAIVRGGTPSS